LIWNTWNNVAIRFSEDPSSGSWTWWRYTQRWGNPGGPSEYFGQRILEPGPSSPNSNIGAFSLDDLKLE